MYGLIAKSSISPNKNERFHESRYDNIFSSFYFRVPLEIFQFSISYEIFLDLIHSQKADLALSKLIQTSNAYDILDSEYQTL
jgi:hypothetical protein